MSAINPTQNTGLIVDEFIRYAQSHLTTISGLVDTTSLYQVGPATVAQPGKLFWTGYTVPPATPSQQFTEDDFPQNEQTEEQFSFRIAPEEVPTGIDEVEIDAFIEETVDREFGVTNTEEDFIRGTFNEGKPFVTGFRGGGGGFSTGFSGAVNVDLGDLNLGADWVTLAAQFIGKKEGFTANASWDVNAYRIGFGTDKIIGSDGQTRKVVLGDTTTVDAALKMLQYEVAGPYKDRLVGNGDTKIPQATFDALNNKQKAALISYVYNVGSLRATIASAIKSNNLSAAASAIINGPVTADGKVLAGLVKRRKEEGTLFLS